MKKSVKNIFAITCASLLSAGLFAQENETVSAISEAAPETTVETSADVEKKNSVSKIYLDKSEYEISLHASDWTGSIPGLSVKSDSLKIGNHDVKWSSNDMKIVKVDQKGRLFPKKCGKSVITATAKDGSKATCEVTVSKYGPKPSAEGLKLSTQLTGDASVTFGMDLDTGRAAFCTDQNIKLKLDILNLGEVWAGDSAHPLWGEIRIFTKGDPLRYMVDADSGTDLYLNSGDFAIVVDRAKIHLGNAYLTVYDRDNSDLGYANYNAGSDVAYSFMAADTDYRYGHLKQRTLQTYLSSYDEAAKVYGLSAGYEMNGVFKAEGDFASTMKWVAGSSNRNEDTADLSHGASDWVFKLSGEFNMIPGLKVSGGYSNGIIGKDSLYKMDQRFGANADYEWNFYDIYYLKPSAGITLIQQENKGALHPLVSAGLLLGWEDKQSAFDYWGAKYSDDSYGPYPGVALAVQYADAKLAENCTKFVRANDLTTFNNNMLIFHGSFNTGNDLFVKNLEAVGAIDIVNALSDQWVLGYTLGAHYNLPVFNSGWNVAPKALVTRYHDSSNISNDYCYLKGGVEVSYERITVGIDYESNDLINGFNDGFTFNRFGNIETSVKVSF